MRKNKTFAPGTLHKSGEDYLESILVLQMTKGSVRSIDIVNFLEYSKPSVSNAVAVLRDAGYITVDDDHFIFLTPEGRKIAESIYERHKFFTTFLIKIGVDPTIAEEDACQIEHVVSPESFQKLKEYFGDALKS